MGRIFGRRKAEVEGTPHPAVAGMRLAGERDARGFRLGVVLPAHASDATVGVRLSEPTALTAERLAQWRATVHVDETVTATCAAQHFEGQECAAVLWATVAATGKAERKDTSELLTRLAVFAPKIYEAADAAGMDAKPLSRDELTQWIGRELVATDTATVFPPLADRVIAEPSMLSVDDRVTASFEISDLGAEDGGALGEVIALAQQVGEEYDGALSVRVADWARPAERTGFADRRVGVMSLSADEPETVEDAMRVLLVNLTAKQRLAVRRLWNRQAMGAGASVGAGVLGWQRLEVAS